jgi:hypothetical protein
VESLADSRHDRLQLVSQLRKQRSDRSRHHTFVGMINERLGDMRIGKVCVLATKVGSPSNGTMVAKLFVRLACFQAS